MLLAQVPDPHSVVVALSLAYLVYYGGLSIYLTVTRTRTRLRTRRQTVPAAGPTGSRVPSPFATGHGD